MLRGSLQQNFPRTYACFSKLFPQKQTPKYPTRLEMCVRYAHAGNNERAFTELLAAMALYPKEIIADTIKKEREILTKKQTFFDLSLTAVQYFYTDQPDNLVRRQISYAAKKGDLSAQQLAEFLGVMER